jgi:hypothetical protein
LQEFRYILFSGCFPAFAIKWYGFINSLITLP